jgi:hypothetical protein
VFRTALLTGLIACALPFAPGAQEAPAADVPAGADVLAAPGLPVARVGVESLAPLARGEDTPVVRVGEIELMRSDVFRVLDLATPARSAEVIRQMVLTTAAELDARREGIDVPAAALERSVQQAMAEQKASFALEVDEHMPLEEYLRLRHGLTPEAYHAEVRRMVLASMLLERAVRLDSLRTATDRLSVILVDDPALAEEVAGQLREGASFSVLAKRHSRHASAAAGGELPPIPRDAQVPLCVGREGLSPGEFLGPAPFTAAGKDTFRLLRLSERSEANQSPWHELQDEIEAGLVARPLGPEELAVFEARVQDRYRVTGLLGNR